MSTLIYALREDWPEIRARSEQDRRRVNLVIVVVTLAIGPGVFLVERLTNTVAWRSFLTEALSLCLYAAVAVWYALRPKPRTAWRMGLTIYLIGLITMAVVDLSAKRGLSTSLVDTPRANEPILWVGVLMLVFLPLFVWIARRFPSEMNRIGLNFACPLSRLGLYTLAGLGAGLLIGFHFLLTAKTAGLDLNAKPWPYVAWQICYEAGPHALTGELFLRGVVFNELYVIRHWRFWSAVVVTSCLELLSLFVKQDYSAGIFIIAGAAFYTVVNNIASAGLFRWSRNIVAGYGSNVVFGVFFMFR